MFIENYLQRGDAYRKMKYIFCRIFCQRLEPESPMLLSSFIKSFDYHQRPPTGLIVDGVE